MCLLPSMLVESTWYEENVANFLFEINVVSKTFGILSKSTYKRCTLFGSTYENEGNSLSGTHLHLAPFGTVVFRN